jgi:S-formylglutathione hydrolase FrmB
VSREEAAVTDVLSKIPLVGWGPVITIAALGVCCLIIAVLLWRKHKVWSALFVLLFLAFGVGTAADYVNTQFAYFDNAADLLGIPTYPTVDGNASGPDVQPQPNGAVTQISVPDTASKFGAFEAQVWLPPQYFTNPRQHFPVVYLLHGNPGQPTDWLTAAGGAATFLDLANSGRPVIVVMPEDIQNNVTGDSLCVDTASQGNAETYLTKDVIAAVDTKLRTQTNAKGRGIGGLSMGGFCALNLGLKHPDLYSAVMDLSGETASDPDTLSGGNQALYGGSDWQAKADANSPIKYVPTLDGSKGPAIYLGSGASDAKVIADMQAIMPKLQSRGFTVEFRQLPGAHEYTYWTAGLKDGLPWVAQKLSPAS